MKGRRCGQVGRQATATSATIPKGPIQSCSKKLDGWISGLNVDRRKTHLIISKYNETFHLTLPSYALSHMLACSRTVPVSIHHMYSIETATLFAITGRARYVIRVLVDIAHTIFGSCFAARARHRSVHEEYVSLFSPAPGARPCTPDNLCKSSGMYGHVVSS